MVFLLVRHCPEKCLTIVAMLSLIRFKDIGADFSSISDHFRVERFVTSPLPHRPVRAAFPHTVLLNYGFAKI